ncbi:hypothetical protein ABEB36_011146 [Hypothenemus hampei]|uniref:G-protein coupled receptors family 1 profile domain-containing protein n=1 Tax=Hypothenemus hampei TaxID=57062 RepID=A0ABD1EEB9_HYPHA
MLEWLESATTSRFIWFGTIIFYSFTIAGTYGNVCFAIKVFKSHLPRNALVIALIFFDTVICMISAPIKLFEELYDIRNWPVWVIHFSDFLKEFPIVCNTLIMMCVCVDRYCIVRKFETLNREYTRKYVLPFVVVMVLILSSVLIMISQLLVYWNLTALNISTRIRHGEIPLPLPVFQVKNSELPKIMFFIKCLTKPTDSENRMTAEGPIPVHLVARRRLANFMVVMALSFTLLWGPYTLIECALALVSDKINPKFIQFFQSIGMLHSALNPILSYISVDRDWNRGTCDVVLEMKTFKRRAQMADQSSTNVDALGPFNPRFIPSKNKRLEREERRNSSVFMY